MLSAKSEKFTEVCCEYCAFLLTDLLLEFNSMVTILINIIPDKMKAKKKRLGEIEILPFSTH